MARRFLLAGLLACATLLIGAALAPAAYAEDLRCVSTYNNAAVACVDIDSGYIYSIDGVKDGHHATAYWSGGGTSGTCPNYKGVTKQERCGLPLPAGTRVCFRAAEKDGTHFEQGSPSRRQCETLRRGIPPV